MYKAEYGKQFYFSSLASRGDSNYIRMSTKTNGGRFAFQSDL